MVWTILIFLTILLENLLKGIDSISRKMKTPPKFSHNFGNSVDPRQIKNIRASSWRMSPRDQRNFSSHTIRSVISTISYSVRNVFEYQLCGGLNFIKIHKKEKAGFSC